jgi:hypothetical protein
MVYSNEPVGLLRKGAIKNYLPKEGMIEVQLHTATAGSINSFIKVPIPYSLFYNNGMFIGTLPDIESTIIVAEGAGHQYYFISFLAENKNYVPPVEWGQILIRSSDITKITLDKDENIFIGSDNNKIHLDTKNKLYSVNFQEEFHFTQASRHINGLIKRDVKLNEEIPQSLKLESDLYNSEFKVIGMDPKISINLATGATKNPPFVENREIVYEFQYYSDPSNDLFESSLYNDKNPPPPEYGFISRRKSRADTLSLTLACPNYLMETIKGTVVDIFGNILDLNRCPLPVGTDKFTLNDDDNKSDKIQAFLNIRELERKSVAYHFEINARKDLAIKTTNTTTNTVSLLDIESNDDYARNRSRFFMDIDKEGQFKINVPASSEKGNIPVLTRYENYSTFGTDNPDKLEYRDDHLDIFLDSFAAPHVNRNSSTPIPLDYSNRGSINIMNGDAVALPEDRITKSVIKHGTAYHDILNTCYAHSGAGFLAYQNDDKPLSTIDILEITDANNAITGPDLNHIVTDTIKISGDDANAGGRSGSINLDGSLEFNIGANTIDRQSLWLDTAGGIVANIGRDLKSRSLTSNLDGDVYIQVGGVGVSTDSRFSKENNSFKGAVVDIRVLTDGLFATMIRIDKNGIAILTPSHLRIHASKDIKMTCDGNMSIEAENLTLQGRAVIKGGFKSDGTPEGTPSI